MTTRYVFRRTTTVTVEMADPGETGGYCEPAETPAARDESARLWAEEALPEGFPEEWVTVEHGPLERVEPTR